MSHSNFLFSRRTGLRVLPLVAALSATFPAMAEESEKELEAVRVTATRSTIDVEDSPRAISVIERERVEELAGQSGIQGLLAEVPGISYARSGGLGGQIVMRGFNSNTTRSTLAIDGDRYRGRSTLEFNMIDPNSVERIEVIRGPASVIWGADAMNGVINVVTRRSYVPLDQPFSMKAHIRAVDYNSVNNMWGGRAELVGGGNGFDVMIGAFARDAEDYDTPKGRAKNSAFRSQGMDFRLGFSPTVETRFELAGRYQQTTTGRAGGLGAAPGYPYITVTEDPIQEQYLKFGFETKNVGMFADLLEGSMYVRKFRTDINQANATTATGGLNPVTTNVHIRVYEPTIYGGRLNATKGIGSHLISYGADFYNEDFGPRSWKRWTTDTATGGYLGSINDWTQMERGSTQNDIGVYVSDEWNVAPALTLSGALRFDRIHTVIDANPAPGEPADVTAAYDERKKTHTPLTGSIGGVFRLTPLWSATAQVSRGYRAPTGMEYTLTSTAGTILTLPSPDLKPEHNMTYEAGIRYRGEKFRANLTGYLSDYKDLIMAVPITATLRQRQNIGEARISGIELDGEWIFSRMWKMHFAAAYTRGTDESANTPLEGVPELVGRLALRYGADRGPWYAEGVVRAAIERDRVNPETERPRAGYAMFDAYFGADLEKILGASVKGWKVIAGIENIFNHATVNQVVAEDLRYTRLIGNPLLEPGRSFVARLVHDF